VIGVFSVGQCRFWFRGVRAIQGFDKNKFGKVILVGPGSRVCHMLLHSVYFNWILASGGNGHAIGIV
jgi:hypothetical protein